MAQSAESSSRLDVEANETRLPPQLAYLYLAAPILLAPVLDRRFFDFSVHRMLCEVAGSYVGFLAIPGAIHAVYFWAMPALVKRTRTVRGRVLLHVAVCAVTALIVALLIRPIFLLFYPASPPVVAFVSRCIVLAWLFTLPAVLVQGLRVRGEHEQRRLSEQRQATLRAQLEALQSRTNPHFLFNALNTIASLIQDQPEAAERTVERLSDLLRYGLQASRLETIALGQEAQMLEDYLEIQQTRFGDRLSYLIDIDPALVHLLVPPLLLQPLVENAVLHGVGSRPEGGRIRVTGRERAGEICLRVEDDGPGPERSVHSGSGTSMEDLRERLLLVYGDAHSLRTERNDQGGLTVELGLKIREASRPPEATS